MSTHDKTSFARRAVLAFIQDNIVSIDMVEDLDKHVDRAIRFAGEASGEEEAIALGAEAATAETVVRGVAIRECPDCKRLRAYVGYPGSGIRRICEAHS